MPAHEVGADFLDHPLLRPGQRIGQGVETGIEGRPDLGHRDPVLRTAEDVFLFQEGELQQEKLLPLEPVAGPGQGFSAVREMDVLQRKTQAAKALLPQDVFRQGFLHGRKAGRKGSGHQAVHHLAGDAAAGKLLRRRIDAGERPREAARPFRRREVDFGMHHVQASVESRRLSEEKEDTAGLEPVRSVFHPPEEDQFHLPGIVLDDHAEPFPALSGQVGRNDPRQDLDIGGVAPHVRDPLDGTPVDIPERIQAQQVPHCPDGQFGGQQGGAPRPYAREELDSRLQWIVHIHHTNLEKKSFFTIFVSGWSFRPIKQPSLCNPFIRPSLRPLSS